jgi:hypothetical protein
MSLRTTTREDGRADRTLLPAESDGRRADVVIVVGAVCSLLALTSRLVQEVWSIVAGEVVEIAAPVPGTALYAMQILLTPLTVVGLYVCQQRAFAVFGQAAFVTALFGTVTWAAGAAHGMLAVLANGGQSIDDISNGELLFVFIGFGSYVIGLVLFGVATWRAGVLPRWPAALVIAGIPLGLVLQSLVPGVLVLYSVGLAWLAVSAVIDMRAPGRRTTAGVPAST